MRKKAFTLIELLVLITIIGLLMALIGSAFGRAKEAVRRITCVNSLRQHGVAWYLYLDEHNECYPPYLWSPPIGVDIYDFGGKQGSSYPVSFGAHNRVLNRYLDIYDESSPNIELFHCPADIKASQADYGGETAFDYRGNSYYANNYIFRFGPEPHNQEDRLPRPLSTITSPHSRVYMEMCHYRNVPGHSRGGYDPDKAVVMVLFIDGHVGGPFFHDDDFEHYRVWIDKPVLSDPTGDMDNWN